MVRVHSVAPAEVRIADVTAVQLQGATPTQISVQLPRGWRPLAIDERDVSRGRALSITIVDGASERVMTRWDLRPDVAPEGLLAEYSRDGAPLLRAIEPQLDSFLVEALWNDPAVLPLRMPFTATWRGSLRIVEPGDYQFEAMASGPYSIGVDGAPLCDVTTVIPEEPQICRSTRAMTAGLHPITAQWDSTTSAHTTRRIFQLFWTPPGGERELVPPTSFVPTLGGR